MRNYTIVLFSLSYCFLFSCSTPSSQSKESETPATPSQNDLPSMPITTLDRADINTRNLKGNTILILFQPDCDHCQREAREIRENLEAFRAYNLYFISADQMSAIEKFGNDYDLIGHPNIHLALTSVDNVLKSFGAIAAPSVYIYTNQRLMQKFNGETAIEKILSAI